MNGSLNSPTENSAEWHRCRRDFETWLKLEKGLAGNSIQAYLRDVTHLAEFMSERNIEPEHVVLDDLQQLLKQLNDLGIAPTSQRRMISGWRMFFKHLVIEDAIKDSPADLLDLVVVCGHVVRPDLVRSDRFSGIPGVGHGHRFPADQPGNGSA